MLTVTQEPLPSLDALEPRWCALADRADASFFLGWTWMGSWLRATGARPDLVSVRDGAGDEIGLALLGAAREPRKLGRVRTLRLNESGDPLMDRPFIEYNAPLAARDHEVDVTQALAHHLARRRDWCVLRLSGVADDNLLVGAVPARRRILTDVSPAYGVSLAAVRGAVGDYLSLLSANTRSQIRRALRDHGDGDFGVERAADEVMIADWLGEMARLNAGRHADNAWDAPMFRAFAREIALAGRAAGAVDLLRVTIGGAVIGYLLNFVHGDRAMNYQSAFAEPVGPKDKPGLLTHMAAIAHYTGRGLSLYSLLAGKDRYKQSLATGAEELQWWQIERFSPALEAEYWLRRLLRR
ncbi:GNAT family N-acetyltransferase [Sphingobium lignivorans]|uniref:CelD/BcsL family acetyltransferase involved in cellulose biosynthesis n=1 Tax=Sphingobium lignivorans TaxID=2735886 RepID=A0ABR6NK99_9SPHN|nr:GNAT family N-acetyltransferase [Sphingobium lignivorans]MBB5987686.1 CelD/BcsL family acetyltransferase involved in cellulose biosynthesis [Sphingobium lignivorans]